MPDYPLRHPIDRLPRRRTAGRIYEERPAMDSCHGRPFGPKGFPGELFGALFAPCFQGLPAAWSASAVLTRWPGDATVDSRAVIGIRVPKPFGQPSFLGRTHPGCDVQPVHGGQQEEPGVACEHSGTGKHHGDGGVYRVAHPGVGPIRDELPRFDGFVDVGHQDGLHPDNGTADYQRRSACVNAAESSGKLPDSSIPIRQRARPVASMQAISAAQTGPIPNMGRCCLSFMVPTPLQTTPGKRLHDIFE